MLEWTAEQATEITTAGIDLEFLPTDTNEDRGVQNLEVVRVASSRCTQHSWLSRVVRRTTLSPTRGRIRWRHGGDCRSDMIRRQEEGNETFCARSFLLDGALFWNLKRRPNAGSPAKATRASHCPRVRVKRTRENPQENPKEPKFTPRQNIESWSLRS